MLRTSRKSVRTAMLVPTRQAKCAHCAYQLSGRQGCLGVWQSIQLCAATGPPRRVETRTPATKAAVFALQWNVPPGQAVVRSVSRWGGFTGV